MRAERGAEHIVRSGAGHCPVPHCLVHRVLERFVAAVDRNHLCAEKVHAEHVGTLPGHVNRSHVDIAGKPEKRRRRGCGDAVLTRARFGDDARFFHVAREERLAERIGDFVRAGMEQVFPFYVNLRPAETAREALCMIERGWPAAVLMKEG